jgi:hypothetical protein
MNFGRKFFMDEKNASIMAIASKNHTHTNQGL